MSYSYFVGGGCGSSFLCAGLSVPAPWPKQVPSRPGVFLPLDSPNPGCAIEKGLASGRGSGACPGTPFFLCRRERRVPSQLPSPTPGPLAVYGTVSPASGLRGSDTLVIRCGSCGHRPTCSTGAEAGRLSQSQCFLPSFPGSCFGRRAVDSISRDFRQSQLEGKFYSSEEKT